MIRNSSKGIYRVFLFLTLFFLLLVLMIIAFFEFLEEFAGPGVFVGVLLFFVCLNCTFIFRKRSRTIEWMLRDENILACWHFTSEQWEAYENRHGGFKPGGMKPAFFLLSVITIPIFLLLIFSVDEGKTAMVFVMLGLLSMYAVILFLIPWLANRLNQKKDAHVVITPKMILLNKRFINWDSTGTAFTDAIYLNEPYEHLEIVYDYYDPEGPVSQRITVPVPNREEAERVIERLKQLNKG